MSDTVAACPECDEGSIQMNRPGGHHAEVDTGRYRCSVCQATFDEPNERERRNPGSASRSGLAKRLLDADPGPIKYE
jgi:transposase-like protein